MFCPNCGTQNDDNGVKCQKCGFNLKGAAAPKFKGTMLMMNSPMAAAPRGVPSAGSPPGAVPWPKSMAKATMIGVAPPSAGAIAPPPAPVAKPSTMPIKSNALLPATPPTASTSVVPQASSPPAAGQASGNPVNPFGGTMLMGSFASGVPAAVQPVGAAGAAKSAEPPAADRTVTSEGAPPANAAVAPKLESTTPSVSPPDPSIPPVVAKSEMAAVGTADTTPAPADTNNKAPAVAFPSSNWGIEAVGSAGAPIGPSLAVQTRVGKIRPIGLVVALGIITLGIYWIIALWGALNDFKSIRQKNDVTPILFFVPILGLLEIIKLPRKVTEARISAGVVNQVEPNVVFYVLFPQIFFIADLNEILQAFANKRSMPRIA